MVHWISSDFDQQYAITAIFIVQSEQCLQPLRHELIRK